MREDTEELKLKYEHENNCNYLVLEEENELSGDYQVTMLSRNKIEHFLGFDVRMVDGTGYLYYDISSKQQLTKLFEYGKLTLEDVKAVCRSISETVRLTKNYMLDLDRIVMEPRFMYMDMFDKSIWFVYLPSDKGREFSAGIRRLFEYILEHFDHASGKQDVVQLYELYQHILIGDYDPENLLLLFYDENIENQENSGEDIVEKRREEIRGEVQEEQSAADEIVIDSVKKEKVIDEEEVADLRAVKMVKGVKAVTVVVMLYGLATLLVPQYTPIALTMPQALIMIGCAVIIYGLMEWAKGPAKSLRKLVKHINEVPYKITTAEIDDSSGRKHQRTKADRGERTGKGDREEKEEKEEREEREGRGYREERAGKSWKSQGGEEQQNNVERNQCREENSWNYTVLLSDYLNSNIKEKTIKLILQQSSNEYREPMVELTRIEPEHFPYVIGSMDNLSDFVIGKPFISRMHACIQRKESSYYIEDLNSTNGTYVNEFRVEGHREEPLENGDVLRLGMLSYKVEIS